MKLLSALFLSLLCLSAAHAAGPKKEDAQAYMKKVDKAVELFLPIINTGNDVEIYKYSKELNGLAKQGEVFEGSDLFHCSSMGNMARYTWSTLVAANMHGLTVDKAKDIQFGEDAYNQMRADCLVDIEEFGQEKKPVCDENGKCLTPTVIHIEKRN